MFQWSLSEDDYNDDLVKIQKKATVPFLLQLSYLSSVLLSSICSDIRKTISADIIAQLYGFTDDWCKYFGSSEALEDLIIELILKCEQGGSQIIHLLLDCITLKSFHKIDVSVRNVIKEKAQELLGNILIFSFYTKTEKLFFYCTYNYRKCPTRNGLHKKTPEINQFFGFYFKRTF